MKGKGRWIVEDGFTGFEGLEPGVEGLSGLVKGVEADASERNGLLGVEQGLIAVR
jgi:hypothetical protein